MEHRLAITMLLLGGAIADYFSDEVIPLPDLDRKPILNPAITEAACPAPETFPTDSLPSRAVVQPDSRDIGELEIHLLSIGCLTNSTDWDRLAAMDVFNRLRIYSLPDGELLLEQELQGVVRTLGLAMSPTARHLAAYVLKDSGEGGAIQIWGASGPSP